MVGDNDPIAPGEFKEVEATGIDLSRAIVPLPYKEPSSTLFQMLNFVAAAGQKFADSTEQIVSDAASYGPSYDAGKHGSTNGTAISTGNV